MNKMAVLLVCLCMSTLTACMKTESQYHYTRYSNKQIYKYQNTQFSPKYYDGTANFGEFIPVYREASMPGSYYSGAYAASILGKKA